ncbi:MAG: hypothetical protein V4484_24140 [Pseudomonadota bacterium]
MTTISPVGAASAIQSGAAAAANRAGAPASRAAAADAVVKLSPEALAASLQGLPRAVDAGGAPLVWESKSRDPITALIERNYSAQSTAGRFGGLGAALLDSFKGEGANVSQAAQQLPAGTQVGGYGALFSTQPSTLHGRGDNQVRLGITTRSGAKVDLTLDSQDDGMAVQMSSSGTLSEAERGALAGLSAAFQGAIDGMTQDPPKLKLDGLTQFDRTLLASVDLHAAVKLPSDPEHTQSLDFHADGAQRSVSVNGPSGTAKVSVDLSKLAGLGSVEQQAKAMGSYLKQVDQAAVRGRGDAGLVAMFKDAFTSLNSNVGATKQAAGGYQSHQVTLADEDHAMLTGLADFSASITQAAKASNPLRTGELDRFSYQLSQSTSVGGRSQGERTIAQQQQASLSAGFHAANKPGAQLRLDLTQESQNYDYYQIDDTASSNTDMAYRDGLLTKATLSQEARQSTRLMRYEMGRLIADTTTPGHQSLQRDLVAALAPDLKGERRKTADEIYQHQQALAQVHEQVFLRAYPEQGDSAWSVAPAGSAAG